MSEESYLFDSHALLTYFQGQNGSEKVLKLLEKIQKNKIPKYISIINLGEIIYTAKRRFGNAHKIQILAKIHQLDIEIVPAEDTTIYQAAEIKGERALSYADCIATATAMKLKASIVTGDKEFHEVEDMVKVHWI